jgi:hypothetical protein
MAAVETPPLTLLMKETIANRRTMILTENAETKKINTPLPTLSPFVLWSWR